MPSQIFTKEFPSHLVNNGVLLVDEHLYYLYKDFIASWLPTHFPILCISGAEKDKTIESLLPIFDFFESSQLKRNEWVLVLGGGSLLDKCALAASLWNRGCQLGLVPTTLLAMTDAALGGKTAVNHHHTKNKIGTFYPATWVWIQPIFLNTLSIRHWRNGWIEMLKHGLINNPEHYQNLLSKPIQQIQLADILQSQKIKESIVSQDPFEKGWRKILNAGHTIGHALESQAKSQSFDLMHGEAVAAGLYAETSLSTKLGLMTLEDEQHIKMALLQHFPEIPQWLKMLLLNAFSFLISDKKNHSSQVHFSLITKPGYALPDVSITMEECKDILLHLT